jgi:hypothetical protein
MRLSATVANIPKYVALSLTKIFFRVANMLFLCSMNNEVHAAFFLQLIQKQKGKFRMNVSDFITERGPPAR